MSDDPVLDMLRSIRADMAEMRVKQRAQRVPLGAIERSLALKRDTAETRAEVSGRFDRRLDRRDVIERRLTPRNA